MASLYTTSQNARKVLVIVLILIVALLAYDTITSFQRARDISTGTERRFYMNPDNKFGNLTPPVIPSIPLAEGSNPSYSLRQPTFGSFPDVAYVYEIEKPVEKLNTYESALSKGSILGFNQNLVKQEDRDLIWTITDGTKILKLNRDNLVWDLSTNYTTNIEALRTKTISTQTSTYARNALNLLRRIVFDTTSYNFGFRDAQQIITLANIGPSGLFFEVQTPAEAQYVRVDLYRQLPLADVKPQDQQPALNTGEKRPIAVTGITYKEDPRVGNFSSIVSNNFSDYSKDLFEFDYIDYIYTGNSGKYFIIPPADAWTKIQTGKASLVAIETNETDQFTRFPLVNVKNFEADPLKTRLAYYEPTAWTGFATPIYVFEGTATLDNGSLATFTFYVNALTERVN